MKAMIRIVAFMRKIIMYLSKLEIQGFKSFARKTVFEFPEKSNLDVNAKSITSVVGPNGSGKSNVSDAIRWVLGEQSLKLIRCKKADDVIFGGSENKARQGFAEVSIYFNNEDNVLPIEYLEVVLTRRVYRDGETEYLINKKKVRLYDILILLAKANFGQRSYSIIGQGMVDHIINISPGERKEFFDEATGVKQYQIKRDQAVGKLKRSRENLGQSNQILQELEPRLRLLTKQIKKLEKRKELEAELKDFQTKYYSYSWNKLNKENIVKREEFNVEDALRAEMEARLLSVQTELANFAREESRKDVFNNLQKEYNNFLSEKSDLLKELSMVKGKMSLEYVKVGKQNLTWMEDRKEELEKRISEIKESLNNIANKLNYRRQQLSDKEKTIVELRDELIILQNNYRALENDLIRLKNGNRTNYGLESVKAVLRQKNYISGIHGTISELGKTEPMYEQALAVSAGNKLTAVVVQSDEVAVKCINYLKDNQLSPVTFLPLNKIKPYNNSYSREILASNGAIGYAIELISFDPKYRKAYELVFGSTIVMDTVENAKSVGVGRERMVTLDGDVFEKTGSMRGGFQKKGALSWFIGSDDRLLSSQEEKMKEIALFQSRIQDKTNQRELLSSEVNEFRVEVQVGETKEKGLSNEIEGLEKEREKVLRELRENQIAPADQDKYLKNLNSQKEEMERKLEKVEKEIARVRKVLDDFNIEEERKRDIVFEKQREMQECQNRLNEINNKLNDVKITLAKLETKKEDLEKEAVQELGSLEALEKEVADGVINLDQLLFEISKLKHNLDMIGGIDPEIVDEHKEVSERYEFLSTQAADLEKGITDLEKIVIELDKIINEQFTVTFKKINKAFEQYFQKIFNGGKAKLELSQKEETEKLAEAISPESIMDESAEKIEAVEEKNLPENRLELINTGIDIMVAPPNKKINNIASLSGGERTMTALALICAIISSNPSPFIVMDEVDAALDESNSEKFSHILQELSYHSQFIVITHNRIIMHVADILYGVAMGEDGISKTLSLNLKEAEKIID